MARLLRTYMLVSVITGLCLSQDTSAPGTSDGVTLLGREVFSWPDAYTGPLTNAARIFLTSSTFENRAVIFSFIAHLKNENPIWFQIWRPVLSSGNNVYQLMRSFQFVPSADQVDTRSVLHLSGTECFLAQPGDRLGFMIDNDVGSLGYVFEPGSVNSFSTQLLALANNTLPALNEQIVFDSPGLPYIFAYAALIDEDITDYVSADIDLDNTTFYDDNGLECRPGLEIPPAPTTPVPTTIDMRGPPGEDGDTGSTGPVGPVGEDGMDGANGTHGATGATGPIGPTGAPGIQGPEGATGLAGPEGDDGIQGPPGSMGATGSTGPAGADGIDGLDGAMGPAGPPGLAGPPGPSGEDGETGEPGAQGPEAQASSSDDDDDCKCGKGLLNQYLILGLIIWLLILTLVVILLLVLITTRHKEYVKQREVQRNWEAMREEKWRDYTLSHDRMSDHFSH